MTDAVREVLRFTCACGRDVRLGKDNDGCPVLLHELPECREFVELDPNAYLAFVNARRAGARGLN